MASLEGERFSISSWKRVTWSSTSSERWKESSEAIVALIALPLSRT